MYRDDSSEGLRTDGLDGRLRRVRQQHKVTGLDVAVQNAVVMALCDGPQNCPHIAGYLHIAQQPELNIVQMVAALHDLLRF